MACRGMGIVPDGRIPFVNTDAPRPVEEGANSADGIILSKYRRLEKAGLSHAQIRHKMRADNVSPQNIALFFSGDILSKYRRLQKAGLSNAQIRHKMRADNVSPQNIELFFSGSKCACERSGVGEGRAVGEECTGVCRELARPLVKFFDTVRAWKQRCA